MSRLITRPLTVTETDGNPSVATTTLRFPNGTVTDAGSGVVAIAIPNTSLLVTQDDYESGIGIDAGQWADELGLASYATTSAVAAGFVPRITSVDNRLTRFDGTTGAVQGTGIAVDDSDNVSGVVGLTASSFVAITSTSAALYFGSGGNFVHRDAATAQMTLQCQNFATASWVVRAGNPATVPLISRGAASQTANLQEWQNSAGTVLASVSSTGNLTASGTIRVGGGTIVQNILSATATLDFPSIGSNATEALTITVTGAVAGDSVFLGCPAGLDAGLIFCASVTAADTVTVRMHNSSGGSIDPASATFRATVIRF